MDSNSSLQSVDLSLGNFTIQKLPNSLPSTARQLILHSNNNPEILPKIVTHQNTLKSIHNPQPQPQIRPQSPPFHIFQHIIFLNLGCNYIVSIQQLSNLIMPNLKQLHLFDNYIVSVFAIRRTNFPALEYLNLAQNRIVSLSGLAQGNFPHLQQLWACITYLYIYPQMITKQTKEPNYQNLSILLEHAQSAIQIFIENYSLQCIEDVKSIYLFRLIWSYNSDCYNKIWINSSIIYLYSLSIIQQQQPIQQMQPQPNKQPHSQPQHQPHDLRPQLATLLNHQYHTNLYTTSHTFPELISICQYALRSSLLPLRYELTIPDLHRYGIQLGRCQGSPFEEGEEEFLRQLATVCDAIVGDPEYKHIGVVNGYVVDGKLGELRLSKEYRRFQLHPVFVNLKEVLVFTALSQCNVWYTICKNRKKSNKQFDLDPLIQYFNKFVTRLNLQNPYHLNILPKKQVKSIQRKMNAQKVTNPLFEAVSNGNHDMVKQLLLKGAKIENSSFLNNRQRTEVKCTHKACLDGDLRMCKLLDSFGANWEAEDSEKMTPIFYAIQSSNMTVIKYLVQQLKVNIQKQQIQNRTPFYWACAQGDIKIIDYFYRKGCNINHKSQLGRTALSKSCYLGRRDIVNYLLNCKQIDMYSQCRKGRTALHNAVFGPKGGRQGHKFGTNDKDSPQCAQILLEKGMNVDILDFEDCTALHVAMSSEASDSIRLLVAFGASLTARNNYGETPLMTGAKFGHVEACSFLHKQCHADILCVDIFKKNLLLLTAKFQQNHQIEGTINPAYLYFLEPFIQECQKHGHLDQLHRTFKELVGSEFSQKMIVEIVQLWRGFRKYEVPMPQLDIKTIESIIGVSIKLVNKMVKGHQPNQHKIQQNNQNQQEQYIKFSRDVLSSIHLSQQKLKEIHLWLLKCNQPKILQFVHQNQLLCLDKIEISSEQFFYLIENDEIGLKEKVVSFCLLSLNFDWINYRTQQNTNILHVLVRKQRSGCIVQLFKALSGKIPPKILTNLYINQLSQEDHKKILQKLLWQKDQSGLDAHQLSLVLKNKSVAKLIEQKLKEQNLQFSSVLDVKQYKPILETDPKELEIFQNYQHERQELLCQFEEKVTVMDAEQLTEWWGFRKFIQNELKMLKEEDSLHQNHQKFWKQTQNRPLHFIKTAQQLKIITKLNNQPVIGIDIEYFSNEGITMISIFQLSSLTQDFIIDCLNVDLRQIKSFLEPLLYNPSTLKIMHGADNDLILIKSLFNLSLINFVDTSRLDIQLRQKGNDLRGLATLAKQYLGLTMSKEYQVSEWRIRPIPKAMLQYAKKDSMILPFLLADMLERIGGDSERIRQFVLGGCKQARRNRKATQPLIRGLKML